MLQNIFVTLRELKPQDNNCFNLLKFIVIKFKDIYIVVCVDYNASTGINYMNKD